MSGDWIRKEPMEAHVCDLPDIGKEGVGPGTLWRCECGQTWEVTHTFRSVIGRVLGSEMGPLRPDELTWRRPTPPGGD